MAEAKGIMRLRGSTVATPEQASDLARMFMPSIPSKSLSDVVLESFYLTQIVHSTAMILAANPNSPSHPCILNAGR